MSEYQCVVLAAISANCCVSLPYICCSDVPDICRLRHSLLHIRDTQGNVVVILWKTDVCSYTFTCSTLCHESWTVSKNEEARIGAFEMERLRKILRVSWTAKKTNEWVLNKAGVKRELLETVKAR